MKKIYIIAGSILVTTISFAQATNVATEIQDFQKTHPTVLFFSQENYAQLTEEQKATISNRAIIYDSEIKLSDIEQFNQTEKSETNEITYDLKSQLVKDWLAANPDVIIISQAYFDQQNQQIQDAYVASLALITKSNILTEKDILKYPY